MDSICVPFANDRGLIRSTGQLRLEADAVQIEFQDMDNVIQLFKSKVREFRIALSEIEEAEFNTAWMGLDNVLRIKARSMKTVADLPGSNQAWVNFEIERAHRTQAAEFVSRLRLHVSELALKRMEMGADGNTNRSNG